MRAISVPRATTTKQQPILSRQARANLAESAVRRHLSRWLEEKGYGAHIVGVPIVVRVNEDEDSRYLIKWKVEMYILGKKP